MSYRHAAALFVHFLTYWNLETSINMLTTVTYRSLDDFSALQVVREAISNRSSGLLITGLPQLPNTLGSDFAPSVRLLPVLKF
jgi:hypothetical protein